MDKRTKIAWSALIGYTLLVGGLLVWFEATAPYVIFTLSVLPMLVFWWYERLTLRFVPWIALIAGVGVVAVQLWAYVNGIWYETSVSEVRFLDLFPLESLITGFVHFLYVIVLYEYFFDDSENHTIPHHIAGVVAGVTALMVSAVAYIYIFSAAVFSYAFGWLILLLLTTIGVLLIALHSSWRTVLRKAGLFVGLFAPLFLFYEWVALSNNLRFFANANEYIFSITIFNQLIPVEEVLFIMLVPVVMIALYELCFDDAR